MDWSAIVEDTLRALVGREAIIYALAAIGLNVHFGYTGLLNFGQVAFMAIGGYGVAISVLEWDLPLWVGVFFGIGAAVLLALLLGLPTLRLRADYLAIVTIAASEIFRLMISAPSWRAGHRRVRRPDRLQLGLLRAQPDPRGHLRLRPVGVQLPHPVGAAGGLDAGASGHPARLPAHPQPVGPGRQGHPRGRGRRALARQERVRLQDAEPHPGRCHRGRRWHVLGHRPGLHRARQLQPHPHLLRLRGADPRRHGPHLGAGGGVDDLLGAAVADAGRGQPGWWPTNTSRRASWTRTRRATCASCWWASASWCC